MSDIDNNQPEMPNTEHSESQATACKTRRDFMIMTATGVAAVGAIASVVPLISSLGPSAEVQALSSTEVDISKIAEGSTETILHRGQPVFIRHRTKEEIETAQNVNLADLRDPQSDDARVQKGKEEWLICSAVCTHLGCVPLSGQGEFKGWLCPCHGSHYDTSGRIRKGPAPQNLPIPNYVFLDDKRIKLG